MKIFENHLKTTQPFRGSTTVISLAKVKLVTCHLRVQVSASVSDLGVEGPQLHVTATATVDPMDAKSLQGLLDWQALVAALVASPNMTGQGKRCNPMRGKEQQTTQGLEEMSIEKNVSIYENKPKEEM